MPTSEEFEFSVRSRGSVDAIASDIEQLSKALNDLAKKEGSVSQEGEKAERQLGNLAKSSSRSWKQSMADLDHAGDALQRVAGSVKGVFDTANALAELGKAQTRAADSLEAITGTDYEAYMNAIGRATLGTVTKTEAAALAYKELRLGMVDSAAEAEQFTRTMSIVAAANPDLGGTAEAVNQISLTIANMSYMRLDQLGISAASVRERVAELKTEIKGISDEEAFKTAVFEELNTQAAQLGDTMLELDDATQRLGVRFENLKADIGLEIAEGFEGAAIAIESAGAALDYFNQESDLSFAQKMDQLGQAILIGTGLKDAADFRDTRGSGGGDRGFGGEVEPPPIMDYSAYITQLSNHTAAALAHYQYVLDEAAANRKRLYEQDAAAQEAYYANAANNIPSIETSMNLDEYYSRQLDDGQDYYNAMIIGYQRSAEAAMQAKVAFDVFGNAQYAATGFMLDLTGGVDEIVVSATNASEAVALFGGATDVAAEFINTLTGGVDELVTSATLAADTFDSLDEKFGLDPDAFNVDVAGEISSALDEAKVSAEDAADAMFIYEHATGISNAASAIFEGQLASLSTAFGTGVMSAEDYVAAVQQLENMDLSVLNNWGGAILDTQGIDQYKEFLALLESFDPTKLQQAAQLPQTLGNAFQNAFDFMSGSNGEEASKEGPTSPLTPLLDDINAIPQQLDDVATDANESFGLIRDSAVENFTSAADVADAEINRMQAKINSLVGAAFTLSFSANVTGGGAPGTGGGGGSLPTAMARGGRVLKGVEYIGGEEGFEFFIPDSNGMVIPHDISMRLMNMLHQSEAATRMNTVHTPLGLTGRGSAAVNSNGGSNFNFFGSMNFQGVQNMRQLIKEITEEMRRQNKPFGRGQ